jgi:hypothetical protein
MCIRISYITVLLFLITGLSFGQKTITGKVIATDDGTGIPSANISEKGTANSVVSDTSGKFSITIHDTSNVLVFGFVGFVEREVELNGRNEITVAIKPSTNYEAFDQQIGLYINSGVINNPFGARLSISTPFFRTGGLMSIIDYQTDFSTNLAYAISLGVNHIRLSMNLGVSINAYWRNIAKHDTYAQDYYALESKWWIYGYKFIAGYCHINLDLNESSEKIHNSGIIVGYEAWLPKPFNATVVGKVDIYRDLVEYYAEGYKRFRWISTFARYYNSKSYSELSIGVGIELPYYFRYQKESNTYPNNDGR